jgi:hypothetical protein
MNNSNTNTKAAEKIARRGLFPVLPFRFAVAVLAGAVYALAATVVPLCAQDTLFGKRVGDGGTPASPAQTPPAPIGGNAPLPEASKEAAPAAAPAENKPPAATLQPEGLARDFAILYEIYEKELAAAFDSASRRNLRALDSLKSKVRSSTDMNILPFIAEAREKVTCNETIGYASIIRSGRKASPFLAKEFQRIVFAHEKALNDAARYTATRFSSQFTAFLKKALQTGDLDLAQAIKDKTGQLERDKSGIAGFWREQQGKKKIVHIQRDGYVWHEDGWVGGKWNFLEFNVFRITKEGLGGSFWDNHPWKLRENSRLQRSNDANRSLKRENPPL